MWANNRSSIIQIDWTRGKYLRQDNDAEIQPVPGIS